MKIIISLTFLCLCFWFGQYPVSGTNAILESQKARPTVIYLVRHAEKVMTDPNAKDPDLTPAGYARASALKQYLQDIPVDAFFTSPYIRTRKTLEPVAAGREIITYDTHHYTALRDQILKKYKGKTVLIAGHTNSVLEIIQVLGATKPVPAIPETKYDYIFKVTLQPGKKPVAEVATYGVPTT